MEGYDAAVRGRGGGFEGSWRGHLRSLFSGALRMYLAVDTTKGSAPIGGAAAFGSGWWRRDD